MEVRETCGNATTIGSDKEDIAGEEVEMSETPDLPTARATNRARRMNKKKSYEESLLEILREKKEPAIETNDQDTHFALSLVPMLKALPQHQKLDVQIQILHIFKNINKSQPTRQIFASHQQYHQPWPSAMQFNIPTGNSFASHQQYHQPGPSAVQFNRTAGNSFASDTFPRSASLEVDTLSVTEPTSARITNPPSVSLALAPSPQCSSYTTLTSPQDSNSVHSYVANFSVSSDESDNLYDVCAQKNA